MNTEIINILTYFIIYSFLGWVLESVTKTVMQRKWVNSGFLFGPFCPIYGIGAIIMYLFLDSFKGKWILLFLIGFFVLSVWEYIVGWLLEKFFQTKYWDYSNYKFNIHGRVCLMNSIFWGILGVLFVNVIHPFIDAKIQLIPENHLIYLNILLYAYIIVDVITSIIKVKNIDIKLKKISELGENIKEKLEKLEEMKKSPNLKQANLENIQDIVNELKLKQSRLRRKLYKQTYRLKKAFPTMKSEKITNFLNEKIDNIKNRHKEKE